MSPFNSVDYAYQGAFDTSIIIFSLLPGYWGDSSNILTISFSVVICQNWLHVHICKWFLIWVNSSQVGSFMVLMMSSLFSSLWQTFLLGWIFKVNMLQFLQLILRSTNLRRSGERGWGGGGWEVATPFMSGCKLIPFHKFILCCRMPPSHDTQCYIAVCGTKGDDFGAVLVWNREIILTILTWKRIKWKGFYRLLIVPYFSICGFFETQCIIWSNCCHLGL